VLADGTVTLHDNGTRCGRPPRALRYAIDESARTATLLEEIVDAEVTASICCGSAQRLSGGHWFVGWGSSPTVTENAPDGTRVLSLSLPDDSFSYRAVAVEPGRLSRAELRAGMDAMFPAP
jgi:hypothetical protein